MQVIYSLQLFKIMLDIVLFLLFSLYRALQNSTNNLRGMHQENEKIAMEHPVANTGLIANTGCFMVTETGVDDNNFEKNETLLRKYNGLYLFCMKCDNIL